MANVTASKRNGWKKLAFIATTVVAVGAAATVLEGYAPWAPRVTFALATENTLARLDNQLITLLALEAQAKAPIQAPDEMNQKADALIGELNAIPDYKERFAKVFGEPGITLDNIAKAIATFERSVVSKNSAYDKYFAGDTQAMPPSAVKGMDLFFGKAKCVLCHNGPAFTDSGFHNIGVKQHGPLKEDLGRYNVSKDDFDKGAFKTPGLRSVSQTAPYMHDGSKATLKDVLEFYNRGGDVAENRSALITPLELSDQEVLDLIEFLKALDGEPLKVAMPELPGMTDAGEK